MRPSVSSAPSRCPDDVLDRLVEWQAALPAGDFRLVPRENLHITLAFLGSRPAAELDAIGRELEEAARGAAGIVLRLRAATARRAASGCSSSTTRAGAAAALAADLHGRLERLGVYEPERRPWLPHLTVVRFRRQRPRLAAASGARGGHSVRCRCLPYPYCGRPGRSTLSSMQFGLET